MTTFSFVQSKGSGDADPASITLDSSPTSGNLLIAVMNERSGTSEANHTMSDTEGGWQKVFGHDQEILNTNARQSMSLWWKEATGSSPTTINADDGTTNQKRLTVAEYSPSASYDWTYQVSSSDDSGTGSASPQGSGSTSDPGGSDLLLIAVATWRLGSPSFPATIAFTNMSGTDLVTNIGGTNDRAHAIDFQATGQSSGAKSTSCSWINDTGHEATVGIAVFSDGAIGGATSLLFKPDPLQTLMTR